MHLQAAAYDAGTVNQFAGDQYLGSPPRAVAPVTVVRTLQTDLATFTGRFEQLKEISRSVGDTINGVVTIHAIDGMPGVGKTALAVHVAHQLADRFPDGQLFVDLHAHSIDRAPADPTEVLASLLAMTGLAPEHIPDGPDELAARWRDRMAGKRLLLVLDNAATAEQVKPLFPGSSECLIIVTSRRRLPGLRRDFGATILPLGVLAEVEAVDLFTRVCPRPLSTSEQAAVAGVVRLCGCLPLAISILAASVDPDDDSIVTDLLTDLETAQDRLSEIDAYTDNPELGLAAAFDLSYQRLTAQQQRVLRLVSLTPGTDFDPYAAAALINLSLPEIRRYLRDLRTHRLIDQATHNRYRLHDLINVYARSRVSPRERDEAITRLLDYYQQTAATANARILRHAPPTAPVTTAIPDLSDQPRATAWLRSERANLLACIRHTRQHRHDARTVDLTRSLATLLQRDGPWAESLDLHKHTLAIFRELDDRDGEARALTELGVLRRLTGDHQQATGLQEQALAIFRELGDRNGEAWVLTRLGTLHRRASGDYPRAAVLLQQALAIFRELGDRSTFVVMRLRGPTHAGPGGFPCGWVELGERA